MSVGTPNGSNATTIQREGTLVRVQGPVTLGSVAGLQTLCRPAVSAAGLQLDLQGATTVDSAALALVLALRRDTEALGGKFEVRNVPAAVVTLAGLYGVGFLADNSVPHA